MLARVYVTLKKGVLDPQGKAVCHALESLGFDEVRGVRVGKFFEIEIDEALSKNPAALEGRVKEMAEKLLANLVMENFEIKII